MAIVSTKAIVLSSLKYSDSSLIVKCYTQEEGIKTYLIKGVLKARKGGIKVAYFQPLTQLKIHANHSRRGALNSIKEVQISYPYTSVYKDIFKQSVVMFLSEMLSYSIKEEEQNNSLDPVPEIASSIGPRTGDPFATAFRTFSSELRRNG